jgi:hypothetical protein
MYIQVTYEEKEMLEARARARGWGYAQYLRMLVNKGLEAIEGENAEAIGEEYRRGRPAAL